MSENTEIAVWCERIRALMEQNRVSRPRLAAETGISEATLRNMTNANIMHPSADTLVKIADYFGVSLDYLFGRTNEADGVSFIELRKAILERDLKDHPLPAERVKKQVTILKKYGAVWPYSLLSDINHDLHSGPA